jgi:hypothetical protein
LCIPFGQYGFQSLRRHPWRTAQAFNSYALGTDIVEIHRQLGTVSAGDNAVAMFIMADTIAGFKDTSA